MSARVTVPDENLAGWQRNLWALVIVVFIAFVGFSFNTPFLPLYVHELGVTDPGAVALWSGVILGITPGMAAVLSPLWGSFFDRFGQKVMLIRSLLGFIIIIAVMGVVTSVLQLLITRIVMGLFAGFSTLAMALATSAVPREKTPFAIGLVQSAQLISLTVGPAIGGWVASHYGIRYAFFVTSAMCGLALLGLIFLFQERPAGGQGGTKKPSTRRAPLRQVLAYPNFPLIVVLLLVAQFVDRGLGLLVPLEVARFPEVTEVAATSGLIISVAAAIAALSANVVARLSQRWPLGRILTAAFLGGGLLCGLAALAQGWVSLLIVRGLIAVCLGGALTLAYSLGTLAIPGENRGAAFGWLAMGVQTGTALSPLATGALAALSLPGAFFFDGALAWVAAGLLLFLARDLLTWRTTDPVPAG